MTRRVFLGIDCGTQSTRALLLDADTGLAVSGGRAEHALVERDDGTREQDPGWWIAASEHAIRAALAAASTAREADGNGRRVEVVGMAVSGQQHGLVCLDGEDRPVRAAKLWNDTTTAAECELLTERLGGPDEVRRLTGNLFLPGYTAPKIAWLMRHEPERYRVARRFCLPHDYLNLWLTGSFATEPGDASGTAYFCVGSRRYSEEVLAAIDDSRSWSDSLPPLIPSRSVIGRLRPDVAECVGLPAGIPVTAGGGDNMCAAIGVGAIEAGPVVVSLGTSGTAFSYSASPSVDPRGEAAAFCDSTGAWLPLICVLNCTGATDWARALVGSDQESFDRALSETPHGCRGLTFLSYLDGERTPDLPAAAGSFHGLRTVHGPAELLCAVAEGVTFGIMYGLAALRRAGIEPREITLVGGGARSDAWAQLCADVLGLPVNRPAEVEAGARGAALQARWVIDGSRPAAASDSVSGSDSDPRSVGRRFNPAPSPALQDAADRYAVLRDTAVGLTPRSIPAQ